MSEYDEKAQAFLDKFGLMVKAVQKGDRCPVWCGGDCVHGDRYRITVSRTGKPEPLRKRRISFDFWNSLNDIQTGQGVTAYDVLSCISSDINTPETFEEFCAELGHEEDSRKAEQTFKLSDSFARKLRGFFTEEEAEAVIEIN